MRWGKKEKRLPRGEGGRVGKNKPSTNQRRDLGIAQDGQGRAFSIKEGENETGEWGGRWVAEGERQEQVGNNLSICRPIKSVVTAGAVDGVSVGDAIGREGGREITGKGGRRKADGGGRVGMTEPSANQERGI